MKRHFFADRLPLPASAVKNLPERLTAEKYLLARATVARAGVYQYLASELGLKDRDPNDVVGVYRSPDDVFDPESLASLDNVVITSDHPPELVNAKTYRQVNAGHVTSPGRRAGNDIVCDLKIADAQTISEVGAGKVEISAGYTAEYVPERGTHDGMAYEYRQTKIKYNHVALVHKGRALNARLFTQYLPNLAGIAASDQAVISEQWDTLKAQCDQAEAELNALREKVAQPMYRMKAVDWLAGQIVQAHMDAQAIAGPSFRAMGDQLSVPNIQRQALHHARPDRDWRAMTDTQVGVWFESTVRSRANG